MARGMTSSRMMQELYRFNLPLNIREAAKVCEALDLLIEDGDEKARELRRRLREAADELAADLVVIEEMRKERIGC